MQQLVKHARYWTYKVLSITLCLMLIGVTAKLTCDASGVCSVAHLSAFDKKVLTENKPKSDPSPKPIEITQPKRILMPSVDLGVDVLDSTVDIDNNIWPLSNNSAHYSNFTPGLGSTRGTMLIYGHHTWAILLKSDGIKINDELDVIDTKDQVWRFSLKKQENVLPQNVGFIYEDTPFRIVVFTCNGPGDEYRHLMYFYPIENKISD